ncbi:hypothetical protein C8J56DRAFT_1169724 [Mycena floridula]|nr:hypothetical protein C8J56DRAFT_1169724 [Mycena floridula]
MSMNGPLDHGWTCDCGFSFARERDYTRHSRKCDVAYSTVEHAETRKRSRLSRLGGSMRSLRDNLVSKKRRKKAEDSDEESERSSPGPSLDDTSLMDAGPSTDFDESYSQPASSPNASSTFEYQMDVDSEPDNNPGPGKVSFFDEIDLTGVPRARRETEKIIAAREDALPEGPGAFDTPAQPSVARKVILHVHQKIQTKVNKFGLTRVYRRKPERVPDMDSPLVDFLSPSTNPPVPKKPQRRLRDIIYPYPNISSFLLGYWQNKGSKDKSKNEFNKLVNAMNDPRFDNHDIQGVNFDHIDTLLKKDVQSPWEGTGWKSSTLTVLIPTGIKKTKAVNRERNATAQRDRRNHDIDPDADKFPVHRFQVHDVHHRSLINVMKSIVTEDPSAEDFHWRGFEEYWQPPNPLRPLERVYGEGYTSEAFLKAEKDLLASPGEPGCDLERVIFGYMLWSDSTHVSQFGQASLWPAYAGIANQTKYTRCKPSARAMHHIAFFEKLPDKIQDFFRKHKITASSEMMAHCRRELFHELWKIILSDPEFLHAYEHGIVLECVDGIRRRFYPRFFTYSADYPERVLIATVRDNGGCPCARCKIRKDQIRCVGTTHDKKIREQEIRLDDEDRVKKIQAARKLIYEDGYAITSDKVEDILKEDSWVPTQNAFTEHLSKLGFDIFFILVVDLLHEFELGVWKALLIHLIRILNTLGASKIAEFNSRFRMVAPFGRNTIRRFAHNVSELKKLAARNFEDILQCIIPCFEGLLDSKEDEDFILDLLYLAAYWHGLAKMRMHTESSVMVLETVTKALSNSLRHFAEVICTHYSTLETDAEFGARRRAETRRQAKAQGQQSSNAAQTPSTSSISKRPRIFNLSTPKLHQLGYYAPHIRLFGTTDSYSTQTGEAEHKVVKAQYGKTSKKQVVQQVIGLDVSETVHDRMFEEVTALETITEEAETDDEDRTDEPKPTADFSKQWRIAVDQSKRIHVPTWVQENNRDPAFKNFIRNLKSYLLAFAHDRDNIGQELDYSDEDLNLIDLKYDSIYSHATAAFNYTSCDVRREQDTLNVGTARRDIMVLANEDESDSQSHPFWYARVIGIYHANVLYGHEHPRIEERVEFLWVRWFGRDPDWIGGPATLRLDRIGFVPEEDPSAAFGFLSPKHVLRACHLIPAFVDGKTTGLLSPSKFRDSSLEGDWTNYYVNRFVDRDMVMRYLGLGVGHRNSADFPTEENVMKPDVLIDNDSIPWGSETAPDPPKLSMPSTAHVDPGPIEDTSEVSDTVPNTLGEDGALGAEEDLSDLEMPSSSSKSSHRGGNHDHDNDHPRRNSTRSRNRSRSRSHRRSSSARARSVSRSRSRSPAPEKARRHKRRRSPSVEELAEYETKKKPKTQSDPLIAVGRIFGRYVDMFRTVQKVIVQGQIHNPDEEDTYTEDQMARYKTFEGLIEVCPHLGDELNGCSVTRVIDIASTIDEGRKRARGEDVNSVKEKLELWETWTPPFPLQNRSLCGYNHPQLGLLLCPAELDWNDPITVNKLRQGQIIPRAEDLPNLLWAGNEKDPDDDFDGFLRNGLLLKAYLHIFRGPSFAYDNAARSGRSGNAALHDISKVNLESIAYTAVILRFCLSSQTSFNAGNNGDFNALLFYQTIISTAESMPSRERKDLLKWWNEKVFTGVGQQAGSMSEKPSLAARMKAQAAERKKAALAAVAAAKAAAAATVAATKQAELAAVEQSAATTVEQPPRVPLNAVSINN